MRYVFTDKPLTIKHAKDADPQQIGEALQRVKDSHEGDLNPKDVVEAARSSRNVLHRHFEWDDQKAAEAHRVDQARELIRVICVEEVDHPRPVRAFLSVTTDHTTYRTVQEVRTNHEFNLAFLTAAERDMDAMIRRYEELKDVCALIVEARDRVRRRRAQAEQERNTRRQ